MRAHLERIFQAGVEACQPSRLLPAHFPSTSGRVITLAIGKAAAAMASVAEENYGDNLTGLAVVPHGVSARLERIALVEAGHPIPDRSSVEAATRLLRLARSAGSDDLVLVLLSGGASALACLPGLGLRLPEKQALSEALLRSGAAIGEINCVRRHLSRIKGGRLAWAARRAKLVTLAISDVPGDRPEDIGSGPTVPDPTTVADAQAIVSRYGIRAPGPGWSESRKHFRSDFRIVARAADAIAAAEAATARLGYRPLVLGECNGEARDVGRDHARIALEAAPGTALISGGELTVRVTGGGTGGRNHEYALAASQLLAHRADIFGLAADTDGLDGSSGAAGAFFDGLIAGGGEAALAGNDSGGHFARAGRQFVTGPTGTNVNDLRIILVAP